MESGEDKIPVSKSQAGPDLENIPSSVIDTFRSGNLAGALIRAVSGVAAVKVVGAGLGFLSHVVLARVMSVGGYGNYVYAWAWVTILALFSRAGFGNLLIRYVSKFQAKEQWGRLRGLLLRAGQYVSGLSILIGAIGSASIYWLGKGISVGKQHTLLVVFALLPVLTLMYLVQQGLRGLKQVVRANVPELIVRHLTLMVLCGLLWLQLGQLSSVQAMVATIVAVGVALLVATRWLWRGLPLGVRSAKPDFESTSWLKRGLPFLVISSMGLIQRKTDVLMLGFFVTSADVGVYGAALRVTGLIGFGLSVVNMTVTPYFSEFYTSGARQKLQKVVSLSAVAVTAFTVAAALGFFLFGGLILSTFGAEYKDGYAIIVVLVVGKAVGSLVGPVAFLMMMTDHEAVASRIEAGGAVCNILLNGILIPYLGVVGAAIATTSTLAGRNIVFAYVVYRRMHINTTVFNTDIVEYLKVALSIDTKSVE